MGNTTKEVYIKMAAICSRSEQCSTDILKKITGYGIEGDQAGQIIEKLREENFLDDERYVKAYVRDKFRINKWGRIKMRYYLRAKGLKDETIEKGFEEINAENYKDVLIKTMKDKAKTVKKKTRFEKMGQIIRFAQNRGFEPELIHRYMSFVIE